MADLDPALEEEPQAPIASEDTDTDEDGEAIKQVRQKNSDLLAPGKPSAHLKPWPFSFSVVSWAPCRQQRRMACA